ncbi:MAG: hypothetical protein ACRD2Y_08630 [Terriglobales bacterium]
MIQSQNGPIFKKIPACFLTPVSNKVCGLGRYSAIIVSHSLKRFLLLLVAVLLAAPAWAQRGARTYSVNLSQLTEQAAVIVRGNVISARVEKHPEFKNLHTVVVTVRVKEALKGETGDPFTFRQYIWDIRDRYDAAGYKKGQELLLLMNRENKYGFSSPTGLEQGRFRIFRDREGREVVVNGHDNVGLFRNLTSTVSRKGIRLSARSSELASTHRRGPIAVADFTQVLRDLTRKGAE